MYLNRLYENGLKQAPQGAMKLKGELLAYIEKNINSDFETGINVALFPARVYMEENIKFYECPNCGVSFIKAPRCPECGQLVKE